MFDAMVKPILLYGSEVWSTEKLDLVEKIHLKFIKLSLRLGKSTPNFMVYGESGRHPLYGDVKHRMVTFWAKLISGKESKLSVQVYNVCYQLYIRNLIKTPWMIRINNILNDCGFTNIWRVQAIPNELWLSLALKQRLSDQFLQEWRATVQTSTKCLNYRILRTNPVDGILHVAFANTYLD